MKAVFDTKPNSGYDDEITERYHFPVRYLRTVAQCVGDWVVFRRSRAEGGSMGYFAVGYVDGLEPDPSEPGHHYAIMKQFLPFDGLVPWRVAGRYWEAPLRDYPDVSQVGVYLRGRSVRRLDGADFADIVRSGLAETLAPENAIQLGLGFEDIAAAAEVIEPHEVAARRVEQMLVNKKVRDANFRRQVCEAYDNTCAVTRFRIINGGGRAEVQAAHIATVEEGGPDVVQNGLALSGTIHWLFDRHLISLNDDYRLLVSHNKVPAELQVLFEKHMDRVHLPADRRLWPHPKYVARHRERFMAA